MSASLVLDTSAVLAVLFGEPGADLVLGQLRGSVIGVVNLAEVLSKLSDRGLSRRAADESFWRLQVAVEPMTIRQAERCAALRRPTRPAGLSLGDRACLALAGELERPVLTADRSWERVAAVAGVPVHFVR